MAKYIERKLGKCLTEYKHELFRDLAMQCQLFFVCSQERSLDRMSLDDVLLQNIREVKDEEQCGNGQRLYGAMPDRSVVKLIEIIDSSD